MINFWPISRYFPIILRLRLILRMIIKIKPLSVNRAWQGRRFKTKQYLSYENELLFRLSSTIIPSPPFEVILIFGQSNRLADIDNPAKPFLDILQKKYGINDRDIYRLIIEKKIVPKGSEFIEWYIKTKAP